MNANGRGRTTAADATRAARTGKAGQDATLAAGSQGASQGAFRADVDANVGEILQHPARLSDFLNYRLYHLTRLALGAAGEHLRSAAGVTRREWRMLSFLGEQPGTRLTELAANAGLDKVLASRAMHGLMDRGLVRRDTPARDRRAAAFVLTDEGEAVYRVAFAHAQAFNTRLAACLSPDEAEVMARCMAKLHAEAGMLLAQARQLPDLAPAPDQGPLPWWPRKPGRQKP